MGGLLEPFPVNTTIKVAGVVEVYIMLFAALKSGKRGLNWELCYQ